MNHQPAAAQRRPAGASTSTASVSAGGHRDSGRLGAHREAGGQPARQRPGWPVRRSCRRGPRLPDSSATPRRTRTCRPGVDENRNGSEQESGSHQVVLGRSRLAHHERVALEDDCGGYDREMPAPVWPADAPRSQEAEGEEAEVEEQRQRVSLRQQDPGRMQQLRVLRVEPVREDRLRVVQPVTEWLCTMSAAKGMWYQSESKLKIPRSSASLVVSPQCAKTRAMTPTVTTHGSQDAPPAGGVGGGGPRTARWYSPAAAPLPPATGPAARRPRPPRAAATRRPEPTRRRARRSRGARRARSAARRPRQPRPDALGRPPRREAAADAGGRRVKPRERPTAARARR